MTVSQHIKALLAKTECVIVPKFGAFLAKEQSATLRKEKQAILPPHKQISFTESIQKSDGKLVNQISKAENSSTALAEQKVNQFVAKAQQSLTETKLFQLQDIGKLYIDDENQLQFKAVEKPTISNQHFGLPAVSAFPIERVKQQRELVEQVVQTTAKQLSPITAAFTVAASVLALLLAGSLYLVNQGSASEQQFIRNSLSPFLFASAEYSTPSSSTATVNYSDSEEVSPKSITVETPNKEADPFAEEATSSTTEIVNNSTDAVRLDVNAEEFSTAEEEPFHVVVGMFTRQENAAIVQTQAAQKGYNANIEKGRKYYRVVIPFSPSEATWVQAQQQLAKDITSDAWIWESRFK